MIALSTRNPWDALNPRALAPQTGTLAGGTPDSGALAPPELPAMSAQPAAQQGVPSTAELADNYKRAVRERGGLWVIQNFGTWDEFLAGNAGVGPAPRGGPNMQAGPNPGFFASLGGQFAQQGPSRARQYFDSYMSNRRR